MNIIGMDLGTSLVKIVECDEKGNIINKMMIGEKPEVKALYTFISSNNLDINNIKTIVLTGVGASHIHNEEIEGIKVAKEDEFLCIATGAMELSKKKEAVVVSMGTGTAIVKVDGNDVKHLGGTGVGGGTLINLAEAFIGTKVFDEITQIASKGDLSKVDLRIADITGVEIPSLPKDITACNFGKLEKEATKADILLGIVNMIFEVIGMMAVFASRSSNTKDIVLIGSMTKVPYMNVVLRRFKALCDSNFVVPENAEFAVAIGAVKRYLEV
jgi:type II pantothenate kinase